MSPDQRLALTEMLLASDDPAECAAEVLTWLRGAAEVTRSCVGLVDFDAMHCAIVAANGLEEREVLAPFALGRAGAPLSMLPMASEPVYFAEPPAGGGPLGGSAFHAIVLRPRGDQDELGLGLLFVSWPGPELPETVRWAAAMLGDKLASVRRQRRAADARHRRERQLLLAVLSAMPDPVLLTDPDGRLLVANARAERLFVSRDEQREDQRCAVALNTTRLSAVLSSMASSGLDQPGASELLLVDPAEGSDRRFELLSRSVRDAGEEACVVSVLRNVTDLGREALERARRCERLEQAAGELERRVRAAAAERVHHNELLRRQALELERAAAAKSQFLANVSHELRTPLNAILGYTSMLLMGISGELTPGQRQKAQRIEDNGKNLLAIVDEVLDIARIESGRVPLHLSSFDLRDVVSEVVAELEPIIARSQLDVRIERPVELPALHSDRQKVEQIVLNLLGNALKFTSEGEVRIRVSASGGTIAVTVTDTGIGIAEADQERIFEAFQQGDGSPTRRYGGTGLGLAICRRLARMLEGDISVTSRLGEGSTFELTLPTRVRSR